MGYMNVFVFPSVQNLVYMNICEYPDGNLPANISVNPVSPELLVP